MEGIAEVGRGLWLAGGHEGAEQPVVDLGWSIRKFVKTARRYRTIEIQAARQTITAANPLPEDLRQALEAITHGSPGVH